MWRFRWAPLLHPAAALCTTAGLQRPLFCAGEEQQGGLPKAALAASAARVAPRAARAQAVSGLWSRQRSSDPSGSQNTATRKFLEQALRRSDPAALLEDGVLAACARGLAGAGLRPWPPLLGSELEPEELIHPVTECPACGHTRTEARDKATSAILLDAGGVLLKRHIPLRCQRSKCKDVNVYAWHNYEVREGRHDFRGDPFQLRCFMITSSFGMTTSYLRQLHLRLVREHVTFAGEAFVARALAEEAGLGDRIVVERARLYLSEGWFKWRIALRLARLHEAGFTEADPKKLDLAQTVEASAAPLWESAIQHFEESAAQAARAAGDNTRVAAVDGNMKNRRSCCGALFQHVVRNEQLGRVLRLPCQRTPLLGSFFCGQHSDWKAAAETNAQTEPTLAILDHKLAAAAVSGPSEGLLFKVCDGADDSLAEARWVSEGEVSPESAVSYFARIGMQSLRVAAERKLKKVRREKQQRAFAAQAVAELAPMWDALSPEERAETWNSSRPTRIELQWRAQRTKRARKIGWCMRRRRGSSAPA